MTAQVALCFWLFAAQIADEQPSAERLRMVAQIESFGVHDSAVLGTMRLIPRHRFVPEKLRVLAYRDSALPIGYGATISQPFVVALMTALLQVQSGDRVLEIGTGSGYQAAVLSRLVRQVYTIEIVPELAQSARRTLAELGYKNVLVRIGDGYLGWPEQAPFSRIILTAAPPAIPDALLRQLANGGRLVAPVGATWDQELVVIEKDSQGKYHRQTAGTVTFVPMKPGRN